MITLLVLLILAIILIPVLAIILSLLFGMAWLLQYVWVFVAFIALDILVFNLLKKQKEG